MKIKFNTLIKGILWELIGMIILVSYTWCITKNLNQSIGIGMVYPCIRAILFYPYERLYKYLRRKYFKNPVLKIPADHDYTSTCCDCWVCVEERDEQRNSDLCACNDCHEKRKLKLDLNNPPKDGSGAPNKCWCGVQDKTGKCGCCNPPFNPKTNKDISIIINGCHEKRELKRNTTFEAKDNSLCWCGSGRKAGYCPVSIHRLNHKNKSGSPRLDGDRTDDPDSKGVGIVINNKLCYFKDGIISLSYSEIVTLALNEYRSDVVYIVRYGYVTKNDSDISILLAGTSLRLANGLSINVKII